MNLREHLQKHGNPLIEGNTVTIAWLGETAPHLISDLNDWEDAPQPLAQLEPGLWAISFDLPAKAYLEYAFYDPELKKRFRDPFRAKTVNNGVGSRNHFFYMPGGKPTPLTRLPKGGLRGQISRHVVDAKLVTDSPERKVYLYHPPVEQPVPLLVVYDGMDYLQRGKLAHIVDNLIAADRISPLAMAFVQNSSMGRMVEYGQSEPTLAFVLGSVIPLATKELNLVDYEHHPGAYGVLGASMGGLMSVFTALRLPNVFGKAFSQAGAFELWKHDTVTMDLVRYMPRPTLRLWLDCGELDFLLTANRAMRDLLTEKSYTFGYRETPGAHNYTTWSNSCAEGLEYLFG